MSEGDVSLIRDEDLLRRMWQQTEDFSRKKEIRAHMYRLREQRLRSLYSPDAAAGKGVEATRVSSLVDHSFQGLKSKEVRDAGPPLEPPEDFCRARADLKELSNAGWNVQSENRTTDDGHTKIRGVRADVQGRYDVPGGEGQFAAADSQRTARTHYRDDHTSVQRDEARSDTAAREQVVQKTDDGAHFSSTTSSSTSSSKFEQVSSTKEVPYVTRDDGASTRHDSTREESSRRVQNTTDYERNLRNGDHVSGELVSRKVDYPDENTKVIVETRCLADGTRVTSTRKEFRAPAQTTRSEQQSRSESKSYSSASHERADSKESSKVTREYDIVDSQRRADDNDFQRNRKQYLNQQDDYSQTEKTEQLTSESKRFETRDSSSKIIRETVDRRQEASDTQRRVEDYDYKNNVLIDTATKRDDVTTKQMNRRYESKINDIEQREIITTDDKRDQASDYLTVKHINQRDSKIDKTDRREIKITRDDQNIKHDVTETQFMKDDKERIHHIKKDHKVEEIVDEKSSGQYQTTYQSDYTQKKISNDLSPTHQAWASSLRADTPTSVRPTTRASSPGSRTYQSSTSSLRSSVSPDKTFKKPSSRGGSPSKTDRSSPSRYPTDRYSTTTSTHSATETRTYKHISPDRKPPISPTRYGGSPERKPEGFRQRPSQSPEKNPRDYRPSSSPERKPGSKTSHSPDYLRTESPTRPYQQSDKPIPDSSYPRATSPYRPSMSPDKKLSERPKDLPFARPSTSPEKKPGFQKPKASPTSEYPYSTSPTRPSDTYPKEAPIRPSISLDRKPGYMRPTAASKPSETPSKSASTKSPTKDTPSLSPERKPYGKTTIREDHYKFIDEETNMYTGLDREDIIYTQKSSPTPDRLSGPREKSPSPISSDIPDFGRADSPSLRSSLRKGSRSPSPPKGPVTFTDDQVDRSETVQTTVTTKYDEDVTKLHRPLKPKDSQSKFIQKEPSPSKYDTYDKKSRTEEVEKITITSTKKDVKDEKYDSLTRQEKTIKKLISPVSPTKKFPRDSVSPVKPVDTSREISPSKYDTYDKKRRTEEMEKISTTTKESEIKSGSLKKTSESPFSPTKKSPRDSVSPVKSPTKEGKYKHTTDFISSEKMTEEVNKKSTKERSRQLITPSTSPTRKPKTDTAPSTGQSSPTTSVSEFVYFSSPKTEKTIVTDLDDEEFYFETNKTEEINAATYERPKSLNVERSPSPSKIPCRSPSPQKKPSPTTESLPRKSSLKKPSTDNITLSPVEKPPSSFSVSPSDDNQEFLEHKVVKKDRPEKPTDSPSKPKAPFERRETYEERCLKILGVVDDQTKSNENETGTILSSPSVSPCRSPEAKETTLFSSFANKNDTANVVDFVAMEQEDTIKKRTAYVTSDRSRTPSRESSPTKLKDIMSHTTTKYGKREHIHEKSPVNFCESPDRDIGYQKPRSSLTPDRNSQNPKPKAKSPSTQTSGKQSPTRPYSEDSIPARPSPEYQKLKELTPEKPSDQQPKKDSPSRFSASPDRKHGYMSSTASTTHKYESVDTKEVREDITTTNIRQSLDRETGYQKTKHGRQSPMPDYPRKTSPFKESSPRPRPSPERKSTTKSVPVKKPEIKTPSRSSASPDRKPNYMRPTTAHISKFEETTTTVSTADAVDESRTKESKYKQTTTKTTERTPSRSGSPSKPEEPKHSRTPSPTKKITTDNSTLLHESEREREVLDRVQQSLRKLSPNREHRSPSRERSPGKTMISLQDIDVVTTETKITSHKYDKIGDTRVTKKETINKTDVGRVTKPDEKPKERPVSKVPSRTVSPTKKTIPSTKSEKCSGPSDKSRSISPKKPLSPNERSQSPQVSRDSGIKPREPTPSLTRKPSENVSSPKTEKVTAELKKTASITKQNSFSKTSNIKTTTSKIALSTSKTEPEIKRAPTPKGINKENVSPKKEDVKVIRTVSDNSLKYKKASPQRMKSKPEIQVNDLSPTRASKTSTPIRKPISRDSPTKLAPKPKSATALNSTKDDDEIIIDHVEQAKSSRENSPDRICPTPVNFLEDVGTPRFPDEVYEPDDDFRNRTHHTIHETESIVDDIVEISEDDELFVKRTEMDKVEESDECLLSVTDKVSKFTNKIETVTKPKDTTAQFKDVERRVHSDFIDENLKSDECLLSVSQKVNKFAKRSHDIREKTPVRKITEEYDSQTTYQDDYTKLSVNDKAHLFVETAENLKAPKAISKPAQKVERPDLSNVEESLKSDNCLLSVSDKVNKFVKTAEQFLTESQIEDKEKKVKEEYEKFIKSIEQEEFEDKTQQTKTTTQIVIEPADVKTKKTTEDKTPSFAKETTSSHTKIKDHASPNLKTNERTPTVKITTLRSSEAVKKAKALFENIASTTQQKKDTKTTKLLDIGVIKKSPKTDSTTVLHPSVEELPKEAESDVDEPQISTTKERPSSGSLTQPQPSRFEEKPRSSPSRLRPQSPEVRRSKSPMRQYVDTTTTTAKTVLSRYPVVQNQSPRQTHPEADRAHKHASEPKHARSETEKLQDTIPGYQRPTQTSQSREEKTIEEAEVSTRRGSGKFGVELRRTSVERCTLSSERRRSSADHHQPCIEDIFDLDLLEQMLEKVMGYEQRRRIRAQIRIAKKRQETEHHISSYTKQTRQTITKTRSPERRPQTKSPERQKLTSQKPLSPDHSPAATAQQLTQPENIQAKPHPKPLVNGHAKEPGYTDKRPRPQSPEKSRSMSKTKSPVRQPSPEKKSRTASPTKVTPKSKTNRFNEYASAYMKKVGLNETDKVKLFDKTKKIAVTEDTKTEQSKTTKKTDIEDRTNRVEERRSIERKSTSVSKTYSERKSSKEVIETIQVNGKRSPSPEKKRSPVRHAQSPSDRLYQRSPSPDFKRKADIHQTKTIINTVYETEPKLTTKETVIKTVVEDGPKIDTNKETIIKTVYDIEKKVPAKQVQEEKPSWVVNRNLKKTSERSYSSVKKTEEKKGRGGAGAGKPLVRTVDAITSSYGPGPLDADGRPLFGIKALRNGASNYQVKGTVIRQEFHSRNGGEPEGTVSVTAYSTEPEDLERLLQTQGEKPSRIHGLAAITTTKKFGGETGTTLKEAHSREERATLDQFTHNERRAIDATSFTPDSPGTMRDVRGTENKGQSRTEDRRERREDKKTVRQSSVKSLTEKYIKSASDTVKSERTPYPKAGLILRTAALDASDGSDCSARAGLGRTDSEHSLGSVEDSTMTTRTTLGNGGRTTTTTRTTQLQEGPRITTTRTTQVEDSPRITTTRTSQVDGGKTTTTRTTQLDGGRTTTTSSSRRETRGQERSFLDSSTKVTGVQDILTRMKNADIVIQEGDSSEDQEARALLNKFLGATVLMAGMQGYIQERPTGHVSVKQEVTSSPAGAKSSSSSSAGRRGDVDLDRCWDEALLRKLLEESSDYEQRRRVRARIRALMAEQEACAGAVTEALAASEAAAPAETADGEPREEEEVAVTSSVRRSSAENTVSTTTSTKTSKVIESMTRPAPKPVSPFAKFRQLEKQNSVNSPKAEAASGAASPGSRGYFQFTDPALQASALTIKERLLQWCRDKTRNYENVKLENFSTSWSDGLAFCALLHHFLPDSFDYSKLTPAQRRHNFTLAFKLADEKAGIYPLLDVDDMVAMRKPDWKCVFTYVQAIHRRFKDQP